jgi:hypothetical protein
VVSWLACRTQDTTARTRLAVLVRVYRASEPRPTGCTGLPRAGRLPGRPLRFWEGLATCPGACAGSLASPIRDGRGGRRCWARALVFSIASQSVHQMHRVGPDQDSIDSQAFDAPTEPTRPAGPVAGDDLARAEEEEEDGPARPRNQRMTLKTMRQAKERKQVMVEQANRHHMLVSHADFRSRDFRSDDTVASKRGVVAAGQHTIAPAVAGIISYDETNTAIARQRMPYLCQKRVQFADNVVEVVAVLSRADAIVQLRSWGAELDKTAAIMPATHTQMPTNFRSKNAYTTAMLTGGAEGHPNRMKAMQSLPGGVLRRATTTSGTTIKTRKLRRSISDIS